MDFEDVVLLIGVTGICMIMILLTVDATAKLKSENKQYIIKVLDEKIEVVSYQIESTGTVVYKTKDGEKGIVGGTYIITEIPKNIPLEK
jgi:hypothetical protein